MSFIALCDTPSITTTSALIIGKTGRERRETDVCATAGYIAEGLGKGWKPLHRHISRY
jgi:hypothetical protein